MQATPIAMIGGDVIVCGAVPVTGVYKNPFLAIQDGITMGGVSV